MIRGNSNSAYSPGMLNLNGAADKASASHNIGINHGLMRTRVIGRPAGGFNSKLDETRALILAYGIDQREEKYSPSSNKRQLEVDHHNSQTKKAKTWRDADEEEFIWGDVIKSKPPAAASGYYPLPIQLVSPQPPISSWKPRHNFPPNQQFQTLNSLPQPPHQPVIPPNNNNNNPSTGSASISVMLTRLMSQGVISLEKQAPPIEDSVPLEFNPDSLKVRRESVIKALYADLPRQCKTCGRRFKCQEEHAKHMDWHLTKNRRSSNLKNRKEMSSRNWFVTDNLWLASATDAVPQFLQKMEENNLAETNHDDEKAPGVPADYNQRACALCGENFEDFYDEETEDWMYRGATYMNRSDFGSIVHAKCMDD